MRRTCLAVIGIGLLTMTAGAGFRLAAGEPALHSGLSDAAPAMERRAAKTRIARSVARGDIRLADAAACYRQLHADDPTVLEVLRSQHPDRTDDELFARNVITHVEGVLARDPPAAKKRVAELELELAALIGG